MQKKARLRKKLLQSKVDGLIVTDLINVRYLTGFTGSSGYLVITEKEAVFVTDFRYQEQVKSEVKGFSIEIEHTERTRKIKEIVKALRIKKLGFEDHNISFGIYRKLAKKNIRLKPLTNIVESMRVIKSSLEIEYHKKAVRRAERAFRKLQPFMKPGITELKLAVKLERFLKEQGCKTLPFEVIVASGSRSALPHAQPSSKTINKGDLIVFDWGGEYEGYFSDMTRTVLIRGGEMSRQRKIHAIVLEAHKRAVKAVRAGARADAVDRSARDYIEKKGYGDNFGHGTGHGVGLQVHERPYVSWRNRDIISSNMVFTVEPGIYLPGFGGVRIEDMVVVKGRKAEVLNSLSKKLKIIG